MPPARARTFHPAVGRRTAVLVPAVLAAVVYAGALRNGYALDDEFIVARNPVLRGEGGVRALLLGAWWPGSHELYRPLTLVSFALERAVGGSTLEMHALNVVLHAAAAALAALLLLRLEAPPGAALGAGAVFAVHPVHVEAVANLVGRAELLAATLVLLAGTAYLGWRRPGAAAAGVVAALYFAALCAKESALPLPALVLVLDAVRTRGERTTAARLVRRNLPVLGACAGSLLAYLGLRVAALGWGLGTEAAPYLRGISTAERMATAVRLWPEYLRLLLWPRDLAAEWGPAVIEPVGWTHPLVWAGLLLGAAAAAGALRSWRGGRWAAAAVLWFAAAAFPVSQIPFPVGTLLPERSLYLPSVALGFLLPPLVAAAGAGSTLRRPLAALGALLLALGALRAWGRTAAWRSTAAVYDTLAAEHRESWWVDWRAGQILAMSGRALEAEPWFRSAVGKVGANDLRMDVEYAAVLMTLGRYGPAESLLRHAVDAFPRSSAPAVLLASLLVETGRHREALAVLARAERTAAGHAAAEIRDRRALALDGLGAVGPALAERRLALQDRGVRASAHGWYHYARLLTEAGDTAAAAAALDSARARLPPAVHPLLRLDPLPPLTAPLLRGWRGVPAAPLPAAEPTP